jgi:hypothetical protein
VQVCQGDSGERLALCAPQGVRSRLHLTNPAGLNALDGVASAGWGVVLLNAAV